MTPMTVVRQEKDTRISTTTVNINFFFKIGGILHVYVATSYTFLDMHGSLKLESSSIIV